MTSKAVISQLEVNERRLKGIYDQLEGGNFKKAICEADKVLKKNPNLLPAKVLKGLALFRLGKSIEAYSLIDEVAKLTPIDENTLNSLSYFYKESNQKNKIVDIYEEANKKSPNREDICANLFYCHTKNFDFLSQQKVATQLKKINGNHLEYVLWPIISNVLHGVYNNDQRLIKLGEATLARYINTNSILTAEIIEFLLYTLEKSNKLSDCLDWLNGSVLKDVIENNQNKNLFNRYKIDILLKLNKKSDTCDLYWDLLMNNFEDVCMWRDYIDVVVHLNLEQENTHSVATVIGKLKPSSKPSMALAVAHIHLSLKLQIAKHELSSQFGSIVDRMVEYFIEFGDRPSCLYDLYSFLALEELSVDQRLDFVSRISQHTGPLSVDKIENTRDIERYITVEVLKRAVTSNNQSDISRLIEVYEHGLSFSTNLSVSEIKPCDSFVKLAVSRYFDGWLADRSNMRPIIDSVKLLTRAINQSSANYNLRLQLSHLFGYLGCSDLLINQFNELEIKQLMWDSLGYFYMVPLLSMPGFQQRVGFFKRNTDRKIKNKLEIEDSLVTCYKLGNYSRIPEIIEFHRDIDASAMSRLSELEIIFFNTVLKSNSCDELFESFSAINASEIESSDPDLNILASYSNLKDFRDLQTCPDFSPIDRKWTEMDQKKSFDHIILWATHRALVIRTLYSAAKLNMETVVKIDRLTTDTSLSFASNTSDHYKTIISCLQQLNEVWSQMETLSGSYNKLSDNITGCPEPPQRIFGQAYVSTFLACVYSMVSFHDSFVRRLELLELSENSSLDWVQSIVVPFQSLVGEIMMSNDDIDNVFVVVPKVLTKLTVVCEMLSWILLTLSLVENMTKPLRPKQNLKRRPKKKKGDVVMENSSDSKNEQLKTFLEASNLHKMPSHLLECIAELDRFIGRVKVSITTFESKEESVIVGIINSWKSSLDECAAFVNGKKCHLETVKKIFDEELASQCLCQLNELHVGDVNQNM